MGYRTSWGKIQKCMKYMVEKRFIYIWHATVHKLHKLTEVGVNITCMYLLKQKSLTHFRRQLMSLGNTSQRTATVWTSQGKAALHSIQLLTFAEVYTN